MIPNGVALVTGSRKGIGEFLVHWFHQNQYKTIGCSRQSPTWSLEGYRHFLVDVSDESAVKHMFTAITEEYGRLDVLVNNAGVAAMNHSLLMPVSTVDRILAVNVRGTFIVSREAAKLMKKRNFGRIVNIGSFGVPLKVEGEAMYVASKSAIVSLSQVMARELAEFGITINVVGPTAIETDIIRNVPREKLQRLTDRLAVKRFGTFADVANVVEFFVRPESDYITGQVVYLGGA
jgi:3-oxoacyl-[acyl-carrier protein] reductase